jgi:hypothetical protein
MFNSITTISGISSTISNFARSARSKTVLAAAVAATGLGISSSSYAAPTTPQTVTSISTKFTTGLTTDQGEITAAGTSNVSPYYPTSTSYDVKYSNDVDAITSVTAGGTTYNATGQGTAVVRRSTGATNDTIWEDGTGSHSSTTIVNEGTVPLGYNQVLGGNNILMGADNVFSNMGNSVGDNTNVVRVDILFTGGLKTSANTAFSIFDRGPSNDHDSFKIAAITAVDANGNPTNYGPLIPFNDGTWGTTNVVAAAQENIMRKNDSIPTDKFHPADSTGQTIGGVLIPSSYLASAGTTIYGYSLFSADANGSGTQLVNWTNSTYFPSADSTSTGGGLDPVGVLGVEYTASAVPEPATASLAVLALGGLIGRRPKRTLA